MLIVTITHWYCSFVCLIYYTYYMYAHIYLLVYLSYVAMGQGIIRHSTPAKPRQEIKKAPAISKKTTIRRAAVPPKSPQEEARQALIKKLLRDMVLVEGGSFTFGGNGKGVGPAVNVTVGTFYISKYEVTEAL